MSIRGVRGAGPKDDPEQVARGRLEALMSGKDHVIVGSMKTKVRAAISGAVPDTVGAKMHAQESKRGSGA